jgi:LPS sulfotransferase NodH
LGKLRQFEQAAKDYARQHDNCHFIDYTDMVRNDETLASLFSFLGAPYDQASVAEVLKQRHSYSVTTTPTGPGDTPVAPPPAATSKLALKIHDKPAGVPLVKLDPLPRQQPQQRVMQLGGVVVALGEGQRVLVLRDEQGHGLPVKWGLPSPVVGKEMPNVAQAQTARFRCENVPLAGGMTYHLVLCDKHKGQEYRLASLSIRADGTAGAVSTPAPVPTASVAAPTLPAVPTTPAIAVAGTAVRPFIIWTLQRTGGTNLAQALFTSNGGQGLHEPFNADRVYADVNKRWLQTHDAAALEMALDKICDTGMRIKHCVEMVAPELNLALARASQQRGYGHVFLFRRRSVDRLLSLHFAQKTGIWGKKLKGKTDPNKALSEPIPVEKLIAHQRRCDEQLTIVYQELLALGAQPMLVAFEDVYMTPGEAPRQRIGQLLDELGIEPPGREQFIHNVLTGGDQGTRGKYDLFPRRNELEEKCNLLPGFAPQQPLEMEA